METDSRFADFEYDGVNYHRVERKADIEVIQQGNVRVTSIGQTVVDRNVFAVARREVKLPWNQDRLTVLSVTPLEIFASKTASGYIEKTAYPAWQSSVVCG